MEENKIENTDLKDQEWNVNIYICKMYECMLDTMKEVMIKACEPQDKTLLEGIMTHSIKQFFIVEGLNYGNFMHRDFESFDCDEQSAIEDIACVNMIGVNVTYPGFNLFNFEVDKLRWTEEVTQTLKYMFDKLINIELYDKSSETIDVDLYINCPKFEVSEILYEKVNKYDTYTNMLGAMEKVMIKMCELSDVKLLEAIKKESIMQYFILKDLNEKTMSYLDCIGFNYDSEGVEKMIDKVNMLNICTYGKRDELFNSKHDMLRWMGKVKQALEFMFNKKVEIRLDEDTPSQIVLNLYLVKYL